MRLVIALLMILGLVSTADARHHHHHHHYQHQHYDTNYHHPDSRPHAWCGWYMRHKLGLHNASLNLARNWLHVGHPTHPHIGAIVVWNHHVGQIVGGRPGHWVINSGNDGHAVRTRVRSVANAIGFRSITVAQRKPANRFASLTQLSLSYQTVP